MSKQGGDKLILNGLFKKQGRFPFNFKIVNLDCVKLVRTPVFQKHL